MTNVGVDLRFKQVHGELLLMLNASQSKASNYYGNLSRSLPPLTAANQKTQLPQACGNTHAPNTKYIQHEKEQELDI